MGVKVKRAGLKESVIILLIVATALILPHSGLVPFPFFYGLPILLLIGLYLRYEGENFAYVGLTLKGLSLKPLLIGTIAAIILFCFLQYIFFPLLESFIVFEDVEVPLYDQIRGNLGYYLFILLMGWIIGGLYEEIVFHGFIFTHIEKLFPNQIAAPASFVITGLLFGLYHVQLGWAGAINACLAGMAYHGLILYFKRNLWYGIFFHAVFDTIAITMLYLEYF
ncbi:CPBP family intramembrane glutamic endopeptidase [Nonlabens marinus]|uniref:CAAX prenyl protease 2/Lysostaphin resistance protein A-like domain-containing protein n=1 Tax=Nonlabens marinus S1-08 TaxID=1454201 RepID=W8VWD4_9FLAO|nr:CPBP family intramembrane glutamic endopeptidase [Nonlabens marinus]BAO56213.1 hypothetical protein NMS_2204 [Nonlabens marinus S1-08]